MHPNQPPRIRPVLLLAVFLVVSIFPATSLGYRASFDSPFPQVPCADQGHLVVPMAAVDSSEGPIGQSKPMGTLDLATLTCKGVPTNC